MNTEEQFQNMTEEQFQKTVLAGVTTLTDRQKAIDGEILQLKTTANSSTSKMLALERKSASGALYGRPAGRVSDDCGEYLASVVILNAERQGQLSGMDTATRKRALDRSLSIVGRTALSSADIPLPVGYGREIVELMEEFGAARRYGTVLPLGIGNVKMPRLKTSPAFTLLSIATAITEKSPQTEWVEFVARKWGGLVRLPSELAEDSFAAIGNWLAIYAAREMAKIEDTVYWIADGTATYDTLQGITTAAIALGNVIQLAATKTHPSDMTLANWRTLRGKVSSAAHSEAAYYCHRSNEALLCSFNVAGDQPYVVNGINGEPRLDGYPVRWVEVLPVYDTSNHASQAQVVFGNTRYHWLGVTNNGFRFDTSRDAAFSTDEILVRALERFTTGLMADDALAVLQLADS